jgi:hypothetical protein
MNELQASDSHFAEDVELRLETLRKICPLESVSEGRARLAAERPVAQESFDLAVERRLRELRSLVELTRALHGMA